MKPNRCSGVCRRRFLAFGGAAAAGMLCGQSAQAAWWSSPKPPETVKLRSPRKAKIGLVFTHIPSGRPTWPTMTYDYDARRKAISARLRSECPGADFTDDQIAMNPAEADSVIKATPDVDSYFVVLMALWPNAAERFIRSGKPTVVVDDLYGGSGEILRYPEMIRKDNLRAALVASSNFADIKRGVRWLEVLAAMKGAKIINIKDRDISGQIQSLKETFGTDMVQMKSDGLQKRYDAADDSLARQWARYWARGAKDIVGVADDDIVKAGKMHVAFCRALEELQADAVTMDCLGFFYGRKSHAYPCLSFFELLNQGGTGICEADVDSTTTALLMRYLCNRPGFVSDPVIDTATNEIIYAHCVASNRVYGPSGKTNPYILRTHAEDRKGVSLQSLMPLGEPVTTLRVTLGDKHMVLHSGVSSRNVFELDRACRTKLAARTDARAVLRNYTHGWHRVTVYGDYREDFLALAQLAGLTVIEEDKATG